MMRKTDRSGVMDGSNLVDRVRDYVLDNRVLIAWALAACLWTWHGRVHEIDPVHQRHDLDTLMMNARGSVEKYLQEQKTLPKQLPDQTLAGFIKYTPLEGEAQPPTYSLEGSLMTATAYWSNVNGATK
jgi:hypothetical protein